MSIQDESPTVLYPLLRPLLQPLMRGAGEASRGGLGPELLVNGDFEAGATGWTVNGADGTHIATFSVGTLRYQSDTISPQLAVLQSGLLGIGRLYRYAVVVTAAASGTLDVRAGNTSMSVSAPGSFTADLVCSGNTNVVLTRNTANVDITLESVSVREVIS